MVNDWLDALPRTRVGTSSREWPAFLACAVTGFYAAVVVLLGGGLVTGRSLLVCAGVAAVSGLSFFTWALVRRQLMGSERLVLLEHVWIAEVCAAGFVWLIGEPVLGYLDLMAPALCAFLAAGRLGCTLVGCCHGRPATVGITYPATHVADGLPAHIQGVRLLPVAGLEAIALTAIGVAGFAALPWAPAGAVLTWFLVAYAVVRFGLEGLRGDARPHVLSLSLNRWMCVIEFVLGLALWETHLGDLELADGGLALGLVALLACALAVRARLDGGARLRAAPHVAQLAALVAGARTAEASEPTVVRTQADVAATVSALPGGGAHVALSLPDLRRDVPLLCELAARALPDIAVDEVEFSQANVLHVPLRPGRGPVGSGVLYATVARRLQTPAGGPVPPAQVATLDRRARAAR